MRIVFFGTADFSANVLSLLLDNECDVVAVVSKPDKPKGRSQKVAPTPVKEVAVAYSRPIYQPPRTSDPDFIGALARHAPDLFVVVSYGEILREELLALPKVGAINLHTSLLPAYRGAAPIERALLDGVDKSGVSIISMVREMDAGPICATTEVLTPPEMTGGELRQLLCKEGGDLLLQALSQIASEKVSWREQDHAQATLAPKIRSEDTLLDWSRSPLELHNQIRAFNPQPGAWCWLQTQEGTKRVKVWKSQVSFFTGRQEQAPGSCMTDGGRLQVRCSGGWIELLELQIEGRKRVSSLEFLRGVRSTSLHFSKELL